MKRSALIHPFLFTLVSILFTYIRVSTTIAVTEIFRPFFWLCFLLALLIFPAYKITKNWHKAGVALTIFVFAFFYKRLIFIAIASIAIIVIAFWFFYAKKIRRKKMRAAEVTLLLNFLSFALVLGGGIKLFALLAQVPNSYYQDIFLKNNHAPIANAISREENPDIYYIILDGYARADVLEEFYDFDNSDFIDYLEEKDFIIPTDNHSNYPKTTFSVASTLNMDYIQNIAPGLEDSYFWWLMSPLIFHSQTRTMLEDIGYESVSLGVNWTITDNQTTDIYYSPSSIKVREFETHILSNTALVIFRPLLDKFAYIPSSYDAHRELILYNFETFSEIAQLPGPQFTYVHFLSPHPPFVFDKNGNPLDREEIFSLNDDASMDDKVEWYRVYREGYSGQLEYLNKKLVQLVDDILENSETPPIIIFQADHGPGMYVNFSSAEKTCLYERFSPFAAYYLPDIAQDTIPEDITPVNIFRVIFNEYFETDLPLLENAYFFSEDHTYMYNLEDISLQRINADCEVQP